MSENERLLVRLMVIFLVGLVLLSSPRPREVVEASAALEQAHRAGDFRAQAEAAAALAARQTWRVGLWEKSARFALAAGDRELAVEYLLEAQSRGELSPEGQFKLGETYLQLGEADRAEQAWEELPEHPDALRSLAGLHTRQGDFPAAVRDWSAYLEVVPEPPGTAVREQIGLLFAAHRPEQALSHLEAAAPGSERAERLAAALRDVSGESTAYQLLRAGQTLAALGEWQLAEAAMRRAVDLRPDYPEAWVYWGEALQHVQDPEPEPGQALNSALDLAPESPLANLFYGLYLQRQDRHLEALDYFQTAESGWPDHPDVYFEQGQSLAVLGDLEAAVEKFLEAVEVLPDNYRTHARLAEFTLEFHYRVEELGLPAARRAAALAPHEPDVLITLGRVFQALGDQASAVKAYYRALELAPEDASAHLQLGVLFLEEQDLSRAEGHLRMALELAENPALREQAASLLTLTGE
jgi:tetratricopeptide (TPR) repeat protein